ncbi:ATP/GTP-binding protein, partial [Streptomyces mobaraensis]
MRVGYTVGTGRWGTERHGTAGPGGTADEGGGAVRTGGRTEAVDAARAAGGGGARVRDLRGAVPPAAELRCRAGDLLVVSGLPGAGKST